MPEEFIDLYAPLLCGECQTHTMVSLTVEDGGDDIWTILSEGVQVLGMIICQRLMEHYRDDHSDLFVEVFGRFPEDIIPEHNAALQSIGVRYQTTTAHIGGGISVDINNN